MTRWPALALALALALGPVPAPAAAAATTVAASTASAPVDRAAGTTTPLPPDSSAVAPTIAPARVELASLRRLGTLRIPAIGLYAAVYDWRCAASVVPNVAIRWGCRSSNNKFIAGHAYGVFHAYYLAYARHRLTAGMVATFTDTAGRTTRYRLAWVHLVPKTYVYRGLTGERWAWSSTSKPALTLQTCWGATNAYRIITRFVRG